MALRLTDVSLSPDVFAAVMATGIVSIAAQDHDQRLIGNTLLAFGVVGFAVLLVLAVPMCTRWDYREPDVVLRLFTFVAACAVLGSLFQAHHAALWTLSVAAAAAWLLLAPLAAIDMSARSWRQLCDDAHGAWELASVGTSGLGIVGAALTISTASRVLLGLSAAAWVVAIAVYGLMTSLVVWRFVRGATFQPDHWILMGGVAIATLAGERIHAAAIAVDSGLMHAGRPVTVVTWILATCWIPVLVSAHVMHLRRRAGPLRFSGAWWAVVFPLGMYSAATASTAREMHWAALTAISLVVFWIALTAWLLVALASVRAVAAVVSRRS